MDWKHLSSSGNRVSNRFYWAIKVQNNLYTDCIDYLIYASKELAKFKGIWWPPLLDSSCNLEWLSTESVQNLDFIDFIWFLGAVDAILLMILSGEQRIFVCSPLFESSMLPTTFLMRKPLHEKDFAHPTSLQGLYIKKDYKKNQ